MAATSPKSSLDLVEEKEAKEQIVKMFAVIHHDCHVERKPSACHQLAEYYQVVEKNSDEALKLFSDTCFQKNFGESCFALGNMYITGKNAPKNLPKALELLSKACSMQVMGACNNAGLVYQSNKDMKRAIEMFDTSCRGRLPNGCFNLSAIYLQGLNDVPKDMKKALEFSVKSCDLGHSWGCANAGRMYKLGDGIEKDPKLAEHYQNKAKELMNSGAISLK